MVLWQYREDALHSISQREEMWTSGWPVLRPRSHCARPCPRARIGNLARDAVHGDGVFCLGAAALPLVETRSVQCWRLRVAFEAENRCCCSIPSRLHVFGILVRSTIEAGQHKTIVVPGLHVSNPISTQAAKVRPCCAPATLHQRPAGCALPSRRKHALTTTNIITTFDNQNTKHSLRRYLLPRRHCNCRRLCAISPSQVAVWSELH
jgi:hypothetical protein